MKALDTGLVLVGFLIIACNIAFRFMRKWGARTPIGVSRNLLLCLHKKSIKCAVVVFYFKGSFYAIISIAEEIIMKQAQHLCIAAQVKLCQIVSSCVKL